MESVTNGTVTDADGKFSIKVTPQSVLRVSYIGYVTQTIKAGARNLYLLHCLKIQKHWKK